MGGVRRFLDIGVPRNIAPDVAELPGMELYNVDDLKQVGCAPQILGNAGIIL